MLGAGLLIAGVLGLFMMMARRGHTPHGALWGLLACMVAIAGLFELLAMLRVARDSTAPSLTAALFSAKEDEPRWASPAVTVPAAIAVAGLGGLLLGQPGLQWALLAGLLCLMPSAWRRPGLFVFVASSCVTLPMLGQYGLWDPWETHYGEVAREILARNDWITLWWAQDHWFRSKPIYIFWTEALTMSASGMRHWADANPAHPEWALRLPIYLLSTGALLTVYATMRRLVSVRAGLCAGLALATTPYFFFLSHQAITDMPFVANLTIATCMLMMALHTDPKAEVTTYRVGPLAMSAQHLVLGAIVLVALPQITYLVTRNITFVPWEGFTPPHPDAFEYGSASNAGLPGNPPAMPKRAYLRAPYYQPAAQGALWLLGLSGLVWNLRRERRTQGLLMFAFYLFCSFAWMAKGIPGFGLPGLIAALYLLTTGRMGLLLTGRLRIALGTLVIVVTGLPWFVAMYGRLGPMFTDRLLIHDHINRLSSGVHGDKGSFQYFIWQLGYGAFPWIALAPVALTAFLYQRQQAALEPGRRDPVHDTLVLLALWFAAAFSLFTAMTTKFHHYIFPAIPPLAMLVGYAVDRLWGESTRRPPWWSLLSGTAAPLLLVLGVAALWGDVRGVIPDGLSEGQVVDWVIRHPWPVWSAVLLLVAGVGLLAVTYRGLDEQAPAPTTASAMLGGGLIAGTLVLAFAGRDLSWVTVERPAGYERLIHLFVYNYGRPWPEQFDYRPVLTGFGVVLTTMVGLGVSYRLRRLALVATFAGAFWFSAWCLNVYMIDLSPHWGQRELVKRYYEERTSPKEPLVAWQMNWKGENFYSGNRVYVFVKLDNNKVKDWIERHKGETSFFVLEHTRLKNFRRMMGKDRTVEELTTERENNKFLLVRATL